MLGIARGRSAKRLEITRRVRRVHDRKKQIQVWDDQGDKGRDVGRSNGRLGTRVGVGSNYRGGRGRDRIELEPKKSTPDLVFKVTIYDRYFLTNKIRARPTSKF